MDRAAVLEYIRDAEQAMDFARNGIVISRGTVDQDCLERNLRALSNYLREASTHIDQAIVAARSTR